MPANLTPVASWPTNLQVEADGDPVNQTTGTDVMQEYADALTLLRNSTNQRPISLNDFREVDGNGDVGAIAANGGILASDTTPILRADVNEAFEISWAIANVDAIACHLILPNGLDGTQDVIMRLWVSTTGGVTDLASFTVNTSWNAAAQVTDTATDTGASSSAHEITATIAAADVPDTPFYVTIQLIPAAHGADPIQLHAARLEFQ